LARVQNYLESFPNAFHQRSQSYYNPNPRWNKHAPWKTRDKGTPLKLKLILFWVLLAAPLGGWPRTPILDKNSQVVAYPDLKGNGEREEVVLNGNPYNNMGDYYFKSLKVIDGIRLVYELTSGDGFEDVTVDDYIIAPLRKGRRSQILILLRGSDAAESTLKIIEWDGRKYLETMSEHCRTADVRDLDRNGEAQVILGQRDQVPHVYDYDGRTGAYAVSDQRHLDYFRKLMGEYELELKEDGETSSKLVELRKLIDAAQIAGDSAKEKDARRRLSELQVQMEQEEATPTQVPTEAVTNQGH
jgi:hypothetical protein